MNAMICDSIEGDVGHMYHELKSAYLASACMCKRVIVVVPSVTL